MVLDSVTQLIVGFLGVSLSFHLLLMRGCLVYRDAMCVSRLFIQCSVLGSGFLPNQKDILLSADLY